ncbi:RNA polymerase sigma factor [Actinomadura logoneensis]|uniref:RNA polymerase sigma factor n=1 Tax=Actinomadura logoneensis TaxID=2293572 RepID=A0A372J9Q2_9ACTN|nr:RNA polymerase sigma factor [Actinomadura logoneensis]RFU36745.1 RNA polymerase sigma factor [Actinomadura logoneensis]
MTAEPSDGEIIARSQERPERFAEIFDRHYTEIHRYVDRRLGADAADDIAAETFLVAFRARASYDPERTSARPWLYGIATNLVSRHRRGEMRRYRAMARMDGRDAVEGHEDRVVSAVTAQDGTLSAALADLAHGDRDVLLLVALAELSYTEVAQALGIAYGTVCSRLSRARRKVREALPPPPPPPAPRPRPRPNPQPSSATRGGARA